MLPLQFGFTSFSFSSIRKKTRWNLLHKLILLSCTCSDSLHFPYVSCSDSLGPSGNHGSSFSCTRVLGDPWSSRKTSCDPVPAARCAREQHQWRFCRQPPVLLGPWMPGREPGGSAMPSAPQEPPSPPHPADGSASRLLQQVAPQAGRARLPQA